MSVGCYWRLLRLMRVAPIITPAPPRRSAMPNPNSTSAPVDGVVVLAPRTPVEGFDALVDAVDAVEVEVDGSGTLVLDELDTTDEVDVEGSVTTVVSAVDDWLLVA